MQTEWDGEQGPFEDPIAGGADSSGWITAVQPLLCDTCGEQLTYEETMGRICWHCDDPVPWAWEDSLWVPSFMR